VLKIKLNKKILRLNYDEFSEEKAKKEEKEYIIQIGLHCENAEKHNIYKSTNWTLKHPRT
jgi:hypothetical protein